jgi:hypothetical protein
MAYSRNPEWQDGVEGGTRIDAANLNHMEEGIEAAASAADAAQSGLAGKVDVADAVSLSSDTPAAPTPTGHPGTDNTAARGDHEHPAQPSLVTGIPIIGRYGIARTSTTVWTPVLSRIYLQPYPVFTMNHAGLTVSAMHTYVQTAGSVDSTCKVALYRPGNDGMPDFTQMVIPETTISTAASTGELSQALASNVALPDGWYWRAVLVNGTTSPGFKSTARSAPLPQMRNESVVDQYSMTKFINASRTSLPTTNGDSFVYESTDDIAPLVLGVV